MIKKIPSVDYAVVEDHGTGEFKWCGVDCPYLELPGEFDSWCHMGNLHDSLSADIRGELRVKKCLDNEAAMKEKHNV